MNRPSRLMSTVPPAAGQSVIAQIERDIAGQHVDVAGVLGAIKAQDVSYSIIAIGPASTRVGVRKK